MGSTSIMLRCATRELCVFLVLHARETFGRAWLWWWSVVGFRCDLRGLWCWCADRAVCVGFDPDEHDINSSSFWCDSDLGDNWIVCGRPTRIYWRMWMCKCVCWPFKVFFYLFGNTRSLFPNKTRTWFASFRCMARPDEMWMTLLFFTIYNVLDFFVGWHLRI